MTEPSGAASGGRLTTEQLAEAGAERERSGAWQAGTDRSEGRRSAGPGSADVPGRDPGAERVPVIDLRDEDMDRDRPIRDGSVADRPLADDDRNAADPHRPGPDQPDPARLHGSPERGTAEEQAPGTARAGTTNPGTTPAATASAAGSTPGGAAGAGLLPSADRERMTGRWRDIQAAFVDQPQQAVQQADSLVAELMQQLAQGFAAERRTLEGQWSRGDEVGTEELRVALQRYRSFFQRLLSV